MDAPISLYPFFYKTTYWQDALIIRAASLDFSDGVRLKSNEIKLIPPLLKDVGDYNLADLKIDFTYRAVCCHVEIEKKDNRDILFLVDQREAGRDVFLQVDNTAGQLHISEYLPRIIREQLACPSRRIMPASLALALPVSHATR